MLHEDRPSLEEQYLLATSTSDLTLNPDRVCAATHLIAAGLVGNRMGEALTHLQDEWSRADLPHKATDAEIAAEADKLPKHKGKPDLKRARAVLLASRARAMREKARALHSWKPAMHLLIRWSVERNVDQALLSPALYHWLAPACPVCDGRKKRTLPDSPVLSKEDCHACAGTGTWPRPLGAQRVQDWLQACIGKAKGDRGRVLSGEIDSEDLRERSAGRKPPPAEDERGDAAAAEVARGIMARASTILRRVKPASKP